MPRLLPAHLIPAGASLRMLSFHLAATAGPLFAGLITALWGLKVCYLIDALTFVASIYGVARLPAMVPEGGAAPPGLRAIGDGLRFIRGKKVIVGAFLADIDATVLGFPFALFPAINADYFGGSATTLSLLVAAPAVGGIVGSALSGPVGHVIRQGRAMLAAVLVWGVPLCASDSAEPYGSRWLSW